MIVGFLKNFDDYTFLSLSFSSCFSLSLSGKTRFSNRKRVEERKKRREKRRDFDGGGIEENGKK